MMLKGTNDTCAEEGTSRMLSENVGLNPEKGVFFFSDTQYIPVLHAIDCGHPGIRELFQVGADHPNIRDLLLAIRISRDLARAGALSHTKGTTSGRSDTSLCQLEDWRGLKTRCSSRQRCLLTKQNKKPLIYTVDKT